MHSLTLRLAVLIFLVSLAPSRASGEMVPFSYHWSMGSSTILTGTNPSTGNGISTGSVAFALYGDGSDSAQLAGGSVVIPGALISTTSSASNTTPDTFATPFSLTLELTDPSQGKHGDLTFSGMVGGTLTAFGSALMAAFDTPLTQELTLGDHVFRVTIEPSLASIPAPGSPPALLNAQIEVTGEPSLLGDVPEPSSLLLVCLGLPMTSLVYARMQRRRPGNSAS